MRAQQRLRAALLLLMRAVQARTVRLTAKAETPRFVMRRGAQTPLVALGFLVQPRQKGIPPTFGSLAERAGLPSGAKRRSVHVRVASTVCRAEHQTGRAEGALWQTPRVAGAAACKNYLR